MTYLEKSTIAMTFFLVLLSAYGISVGGVNVQNALNNVFAPFPTFNNVFNFKGCAWYDYNCNTQNIVTATAAIAFVGEYPATLLATIIGRVSSFLSIIVTVLFGPQIGLASVPFLNFAFIGIIVLPAAYEIFRMARGNASAGTL